MNSKEKTFVQLSGYYFLASLLSLFVTFLLGLPSSAFLLKSIVVGMLYGLLSYLYYKSDYTFLFVVIVALPVVSMKFVAPLDWLALIQYILIFLGTGLGIVFILRKKLIN